MPEKIPESVSPDGFPINPQGQRYCTAARPMPKGAAGQWVHPDAVCVDEDYAGLAGGGDFEQYKCPHCGKLFWIELPD